MGISVTHWVQAMKEAGLNKSKETTTKPEPRMKYNLPLLIIWISFIVGSLSLFFALLITILT